MKTHISTLLFIPLIFLGCIQTRELALSDFSTETLHLPFKIDHMTINDHRDSLLPMNWDLPLINTKKQEWKGNPVLSESNRNDIHTIVRKAEKVDGIPVHLEYNIIEGACEIRSDWKSVMEYAKFKAEVVLQIPSRNYTYRSYAEMYFTNPTLSGTEQGTMRLYDQAVKNVTHMILKQIRDELKL